MKRQIYEKLMELQEFIWRSDDLIHQEHLFEVQRIAAEATLLAAAEVGELDELLERFPWLYSEAEREVDE